ncbi:hypothetical protein [Nocardia brevicatena]|uniref:hypothetical protein n=1 Tax=Nocardia brevicatena TaxID=37327 RepID=UPI00030F963D|nr:hypothetical protein [Nocardia brevicatena]
MIPALIPPQAPLDQLVHGPAPIPPAHHVADGDVVYGVCTVGEAGRILDRHVFTTLGWHPGTRLDIDPTDDALLVGRLPSGPIRITADGFFRVPFRQRRRVHLFVGDRVLLIGRRSSGRLLLYPPAALNNLLGARLALLGG